MLIATAVLQVTLTMCALAKDPAIALIIYVGGATLIVLLTIRRGFWMIFYGLSDRLDAPADIETGNLIGQSLLSVTPAHKIASIRSRRSRTTIFAELQLKADDYQSGELLRSDIFEIEQSFGESAREVDFAVVLMSDQAHSVSSPSLRISDCSS